MQDGTEEEKGKRERKKVKWWKLRNESCCVNFRKELRQALGCSEKLPDECAAISSVR